MQLDRKRNYANPATLQSCPIDLFNLLSLLNQVSVQNEGTVMNSYKIDVPDTLDGNKLRDNLAKHIGEVDGMKDQWPSDKNEAYRIVSQHILAAITDTH